MTLLTDRPRQEAGKGSYLEHYRASESEQIRTADLIRLLPTGRRNVLDIGARDGHFSRLLADYFAEVTALDLQKPRWEIPRVTPVAGNVTKLNFPDNFFDCVFCAEVLEHVKDVQMACKEIVRVARHEILVGVPFQQDIRLERNTCRRCGKTTPAWGHVNSFNEKRLRDLFPGTRVISRSFVGTSRALTNPVSAFLMDLGGNPWGTYGQEEPCTHCGAKLTAPGKRPLWQKLCSALAARLNRVQTFLTAPHGDWIHIVFSKQPLKNGAPQHD